MKPQPLLIILGATASGKTALAVHIAKEMGAEIISADSRQVFRGMDIGTGKDRHLYEAAGITYHLIDHIEAGETYHVHQFKRDFYAAMKAIGEKNRLPLLCGGTGMYIHSLLQNQPYTAVPVNTELREQLATLNQTQLQRELAKYPKEYTSHVDRSSQKRIIRAIEVASYLQQHPLPKNDAPALQALVIGLVDEVSLRREKIAHRLEQRLQEGLIEEVERLLARGIKPEMLTFYGLEYKLVTAFLQKEMDYDTFKIKLHTAICQFAKRQMTFFRKMEKDGVHIHWLNAAKPLPELVAETRQILEADPDWHAICTNLDTNRL